MTKFNPNKLLTMGKIYYGCAKGYLDGSHVVIKKEEKCLIPTADCFWKDLHDVINTMKTCSQIEKQKIIVWKSMMNYFNRKTEMQNSIQ